MGEFDDGFRDGFEAAARRALDRFDEQLEPWQSDFVKRWFSEPPKRRLMRYAQFGRGAERRYWARLAAASSVVADAVVHGSAVVVVAGDATVAAEAERFETDLRRYLELVELEWSLTRSPPANGAITFMLVIS